MLGDGCAGFIRLLMDLYCVGCFWHVPDDSRRFLADQSTVFSSSCLTLMVVAGLGQFLLALASLR